MQQSEHPLLLGPALSPHDTCVAAFVVVSVLWALGVVWFDCRYRLIPWRLTLIGSAMVVAGESWLFHEWKDVLCCSAIWSGLYASVGLVGAFLGSRRPGIGGADMLVGAACGAWLTHGGVLLVIVAIGCVNIISIVMQPVHRVPPWTTRNSLHSSDDGWGSRRHYDGDDVKRSHSIQADRVSPARNDAPVIVPLTTQACRFRILIALHGYYVEE